MNLLTETLIISGGMIVLCGVPLFLPQVRNHSKFFFLLGTGALVGILLFDLLPDLFQMGGASSLWLVAAVWGFYSLFHLSHIRHHKTFEHNHAHGKTTFFFLTAMVAHCITSGMLLVLSDGLTDTLNKTVFFALLAHKGFEALTVSSILVERLKSKRSAIFCTAIYSLSLPAGVLLTLGLRPWIGPSIAVVATSLAAGTLVSCLVYDFLLPSVVHIRNRRFDLAWIFVGLLITQAVMKFL